MDQTHIRYSTSSSCSPTQPSLLYDFSVSPTIFRDGPYRFFFFSREESRMHVHVYSSNGEAKFWMRPRIELAQNWGIPSREISVLARIISSHADEIAAAWRERFGS